MANQPRYPLLGLIPIITGLAWLSLAADSFFLLAMLAVVPGLVLIGCGVSILFWPGDERINNLLALAALVATLLALPFWFAAGLWGGLFLFLASAACWPTAGYLAVRQDPSCEDVPEAELNVKMGAKVAADNAILGFIEHWTPMPTANRMFRILHEMEQAQTLFSESGYIDKPESYHQTPPALEGPVLKNKTIKGHDVTVMRFLSGYEPRSGEPGRERWLDYQANREANAIVLRHTDGPRPWLVAIHGFQMGTMMFDFELFPPEVLHHKYGMNVIMPTLPLHGPRKQGKLSGDGYLGADFMDSIHAEAQAMWDIRRMISWIRQQDDQPIGVLGYSLGGYNTALLSCLEDDLACAIAGIPLADIPRVVWHHAPVLSRRYMERTGISLAKAHELTRVISPLSMPCRVPKAQRFIFGGVADQMVPADHVRDLWRHWEQPEIHWYQGGHLIFQDQPGVGRLIKTGLQAGRLIN